MKTLIYQYWEGDKIPLYASVSKEHMSEYAKTIGADYRFDLNHHYFGKIPHAQYYNAFRPIYDPVFYENYDRILFCDLDIFITNHGKNINIFDEPITTIGICEEKHQPQLRYSALLQKIGSINGKKDEHWAKLVEAKYNIVLPRESNNRLKVFNSGVVLYTQAGLETARKNFKPFQEYIDIIKQVPNSFYQIDQNYLHAMLEYALKCQYSILDADVWNAQMHRAYTDATKNTKIFDGRVQGKTNFVHFQIRPRDKLKSKDMIEFVINHPVSEWPIDLQ